MIPTLYINTGPADKRVRILRYKPILQGMPHNSEDILQPGLTEHYIQPPEQHVWLNSHPCMIFNRTQKF